MADHSSNGLIANASPVLVALLRRSGMSNEEIRATIENVNATHGRSNGGGNGGTPAGTPTDPASPPFMSFDPALEAEQRALERGLENLLQDTHRERTYARQDAAQSIQDLQQDKHRGIHDVHQERRRGIRDIGVQRTEVQRDATRGREDFSTRLSNLIHNFSVQGHTQMQAANAQGVLDSSTTQASDAARSANFARARQPIDTGLQRLGENEQSALQKLATGQSDLLHDTHQAAHRLRQDVAHDTQLTEQQLNRQERDIHLRRQRAREEEAIGQVDLTNQEIFSARQAHLGAFDTSGNRRRRRNQ